MLIYSDVLTRERIERICEVMGIELFDPSDDFFGARARRFKTCIRPSHLAQGERWRKVRVDQFTGRERRIWACSWDAHYVFFGALFALDPNARVKSSVDHWKGEQDFHQRAPASGDANWGSMYMPQYAHEMCHEPLPIAELRRLGFVMAEIGLHVHTGGAEIHTLNMTNIRKCPHLIMVAEHFRPDGSCRCDDPTNTIMAEWGYKLADGRWV